MPLEDEYADDVDFLDEELLRLQFILPVATHVLNEYNLNANCSKTEFVHFYLAEKDAVDSKYRPIKDNEPWRSTKLLGSYMCSTYDIGRRCILGNVAFNKFKDVWLQGKIISLRKLIQVYEAMVTSVMLYNCSSWSAPQVILEKLDVCQRKHLRSILNIRWPATITNIKLYDLCNITALSTRVKVARWRMFGHILRSPENSPAALALSFAVVGSKSHKGRRGAHKMNLLKTIRKDLSITATIKGSSYTTLTLKSQEDIDYLRELAHDRRRWKELFYCRTML